MCLLVAFACSGDAGTGHSSSQELEIRLDLRPFEKVLSTYIILRPDGVVRSTQYSPSRFSVTAEAEGPLPVSVRDRLSALLASPELWQEMGRGQPSTGLQRGDLYRLRLDRPDHGVVETGGFLADAPPAVQSVVKELLRLTEEHALPASPSMAYLRSEPIEPRRLDRIRERGMVRLLPMAEIPSALHPPLTESAGHPFDFIPIQKGAYDRLLPLASHGHELFVIDRGEGHQVALYTGAASGGPRESRKEVFLPTDQHTTQRSLR